jgi:hypothetical protein
MSRRKAALALASLCLALAALLPAGASAAAPAWTLSLTPLPANFAPGRTVEYLVVGTNVGAGPTTSESVLEVNVPGAPGELEILDVDPVNSDPSATEEPECEEPSAQVIACKTDKAIAPGRLLWAQIKLKVSPAAPEGATLQAKARIGGGGGADVSATAPTPVQADPVPFGFLPGFTAPTTDEDGAAATLAGSHPFQQTIGFAFPTANPGDKLTNAGHPRDIYVELPRGMSGAPAASPVLCTEAELTADGCPKASQVGVVDVTTLIAQQGIDGISTTNLYNMVPPPGSVAELATNVAGAGLFVHAIAGVRSDGDYGIEAATRDALAFGQQPIFGVQAQVWGEPTAPAHDAIRDVCVESEDFCPAETLSETALLSMPGDCPGRSLPFKVFADIWEEPGQKREAFYESADTTGTPSQVTGCGELEFKPTIESRPTTNLTDSPSGLDFDLHQPQNTDADSRSTANLRDATVTFPAGMAVNASQAAGLGACTEGQVGFQGQGGATLFFSKAPQSCPDAAKLGTIEVTSPALVRRNAAHLVEEADGKQLLEPLHGSIYLAKPFANPFGSLIAVYLAVEDEKTGIVAKLAGRGELDPHTGQITTIFRENPEQPFEDIRAHLFGGPRGALITPPVCGSFATAAELTPWSAPEGKNAHPEGSFQTTSAPGGGTCPTSEAQMPNAPKLIAGTASPAAGKYSPLLFKVSREDGSQRLGKLEATLPTGLSAKLAGVAQCSEADIAKAKSREAPNKGALEQADPSCPAASQLGVVNAAAGAGPTPYYTQGHAYLAGPYKGAPISLVAIAPAVAGPFDLGTVVVRSAIYLDPTTAQGRVVSDPLPAILDGVPIDVRSVAVRAERPKFSLNPTSCDPKSFAGTATSTLGLVAPISERFQVGGCKSLPYKPKLHLRLFGPIHRGGHPRFRAVFQAKPGEANTASVSLTLPHSEFIDQAHFRTICTRVQYAANQCPAGSIYGHVKAFSPLLGYPLEGPIYLRSSSHELPDVVAALRGPASQPIAFDLAGRVDSVGGGLRTRIETIPDAPVTKAIVTLQGAKKGLFQNSTNICKGTFRATLNLVGQNGKVSNTKPVVKADCPKPKGGKGKGGKGAKSGGHH